MGDEGNEQGRLGFTAGRGWTGPSGLQLQEAQVAGWRGTRGHTIGQRATRGSAPLCTGGGRWGEGIGRGETLLSLSLRRRIEGGGDRAGLTLAMCVLRVTAQEGEIDGR